VRDSYSLEFRLVVVGALVTTLTLTLCAAFVALEFIRGEFAIEERSLLSQALEWSERVETNSAGQVQFAIPPEPTNAPDAPFTGVLTGALPIYGYALFDRDGKEVASSDQYVLMRSKMLAKPGKPQLLEGPDRTTGNMLFVAEVFIPGQNAYLHVSRLREDEDARANTFFGQIVEDFVWLALAILLGVTIATVFTIRISLAGLRRLARQAESLDIENLPKGHLDTKIAPREIQPIVTAFNAALDRIGAGMQAKREFSIHVAHELRTPLADLRLRVEVVPDRHDRTRMLADIDSMTRLLEQLLQVARLDAAAGFALAHLHLSEVISATLSEMAPRLLAHGWEIELKVSSEATVWVIGHETLIHLVLRNLIENVIHHAEGGNKVHVEIGPGPKVVFADDGCGMGPQQVGQLFGKVTPAYGGPRKGSGLGLSICQSAMNRMGGSITVVPAQSPAGTGAGTKFLIQFQSASPTQQAEETGLREI
jgi:signal transduction histidine kinase